MKKLSLLLLATTLSTQAFATSPTLSDSLGSSDKSDYPITKYTMGRAIISQLKYVDGNTVPQEVISLGPIMSLRNMRQAYSDPRGNTFPVENASYEHVLYKLGATALYSFAHYVDSGEALRELDQKLRLQIKPDMKPIVNFIHPKNEKEAYCLNVNWTGSNCPDVFQDGLQEDELACFKGKQYLKCQIECKEIVSGRNLDFTEGTCK